MELSTITIKEYLNRKGIAYRESNGELITKCLFNDCYKDSNGNEAHLYFNSDTSQYNCKKCGEKGNIFTLAKFYNDPIAGIALTPIKGRSEQLKAESSPTIALNPALVDQYHKALPDTVRQYLNERGIDNEIINDFKLGWGEFYKQNWITFPIPDQAGQYRYFKLRQDPNKGKKKITSHSGITAEIYSWKILQQAQDFIVICEGECDSLLLLTQGVPAITSTHGAGTFKQEWVRQFTKFEKIYVCYDNDKAGKEGAQMVIRRLQDSGCKTVYRIDLPDDLGNGGDITDYFIKFGGNVDDLFLKLAKPVSNPNIPALRVKKVSPPAKPVSFEQWQTVIKDNFPDLLFPAEISLSILGQLLITDITNPFALVLVDVPSSGKTIAINFFDGIEELTYSTDKFTPASFVSSAANVAKEDLAEVDLLPRIQYKMFLIRDFATIFSKREDDLNEILGILTRVLDGEGLSLDSGIHGQREYRGEYLFMMLAASTPIPPRVWKMMGNLGSRLFFLNMHTLEKSEEQLINQLTSATYKKKEAECRETTKNFLYSLWNTYPQGIEWDRIKDDQELIRIIVYCAKLLARLRGVINVWKDRNANGEEYDFTQPVIEKPDRINQALYNLARGHALAQGRTQIARADLKPVIELAIDSASSIRSKLFRALLGCKGTMTTSTVMDNLNCSRPTALKEMEALKVLGICNQTQDSQGIVGEPEKMITVVGDLNWFFSDECREVRGLA